MQKGFRCQLDEITEVLSDNFTLVNLTERCIGGR
jgi:hypothetical protein